MLAERRVILEIDDTIATFAREMSDFLKTSELTEAKAFVRSFIKQMLVKPGKETILYTYRR